MYYRRVRRGRRVEDQVATCYSFLSAHHDRVRPQRLHRHVEGDYPCDVAQGQHRRNVRTRLGRQSLPIARGRQKSDGDTRLGCDKAGGEGAQGRILALEAKAESDVAEEHGVDGAAWEKRYDRMR